MNQRANARGWIVAAAAGGAISVLAGAFAAHGIDPVGGSEAVGWLQTASVAGGLHSLAILAVAALSGTGSVNDSAARVAQVFFVLGSILFPAALYTLALGGPRWLGAVAPAGGIMFVVGWICLAIAALKARPERRPIP